MKKYRILHIPTGVFYEVSVRKQRYYTKNTLLNCIKGEVCDELWKKYCDIHCGSCLWAVDTKKYYNNEYDIQEIL